MVKKLLKDIYYKLVSGKQKALVAGLFAAVGSYVARHGLTLDMSLGNALQALLIGALAHFGVYFKSNKA